MPLALVDYKVATVNQPGPSAVSAVAEVALAFPLVPIGYLWRVELLSLWVIGNNPYGNNTQVVPQAFVYDQVPAPGIVPVDFTILGPQVLPPPVGPPPGNAYATSPIYGEVADWNSPITVLGGGQLNVVLTNINGIGNAGTPATCLARAQYALFQGVAGSPQPILVA